MAWAEHQTARQGSIELVIDAVWSQRKVVWISFPKFPYQPVTSLGYFWGLSPLFIRCSLQHSGFGFSFCSQAGWTGLTSPFLSLLSSPVSFSPWLVLSSRRPWRLVWEGAAPGGSAVRQIHCSGGACAGKPLQVWPSERDEHKWWCQSLFQQTLNSIFSGIFHLVEYVRLRGTAALVLLLLQHRLTLPVNLVMKILSGLCVSFSFCP